MDQRLLIELKINNDGNIAVIDNTPYEDWGVDVYDHVAVERILTWDDKILYTRIKDLEESCSYDTFNASDPFEILEDGLYIYQKLIVPKREHSGDSKYYFKDGHLYDAYTNNQVEFEYVWENKDSSINMFWFEDGIFSLYDITECFILSESERIKETIKHGCNTNCLKPSLSQNADFLSIVVITLMHLIRTHDYVTAQNILDGLKTCNGICKPIRRKLNDCGCNGRDS